MFWGKNESFFNKLLVRETRDTSVLLRFGKQPNLIKVVKKKIELFKSRK